MKSNQHVEPVIDVAKATVTFKVKGHNDIVLEMNKLHQNIVVRAAMAGMAQVRIVDAAAVPANYEDGTLIPEATRIEMKYARMKALVDHYMSGTAEWSRRGDGGGGRPALVIEALARVKGVDMARAREMIETHASVHKITVAKAQAFFRDNPGKVHDMCETIRAERAAAPAISADDVDAMLDNME